MYIDLFRSIDHSHVSNIFFRRIVTIFVPPSSVTFISSFSRRLIYSGDFPLEISFMGFATSASVIASS